MWFAYKITALFHWIYNLGVALKDWKLGGYTSASNYNLGVALKDWKLGGYKSASNYNLRVALKDWKLGGYTSASNSKIFPWKYFQKY